MRVYDLQGNFKGILLRLEEIESLYIRHQMEPFVRIGCYIFQEPSGVIGATPGGFATLKPEPSWEEVSEAIERADSEHCSAIENKAVEQEVIICK